MNKFNRIRQICSDLNGCKATELVTACTTNSIQNNWDFNIEDLDAAVNHGYLIEFEYSLPNNPERLRSFYIPVDSAHSQEARIINNKVAD